MNTTSKCSEQIHIFPGQYFFSRYPGTGTIAIYHVSLHTHKVIELTRPLSPAKQVKIEMELNTSFIPFNVFAFNGGHRLFPWQREAIEQFPIIGHNGFYSLGTIEGQYVKPR